LTSSNIQTSRSDDTPASVAERAARRAFLPDPRYAATPTRASLQRITRADVLGFHRRWVRPAHTVLVLAGAVDADTALALAQRHLGDWRADDAAAALPAPVRAAEQVPARVQIDMPGSGQAGVCLLLPFDVHEPAQRVTARVANAVFGLGYSARLNEQVRIRRGLSYDARSTLAGPPGAVWLLAQAQTDAANAAQLLALMRDTLRSLATDPPSAHELAARRAALVGAFAHQLDSVDALARLLVAQVVAARPLLELRTFVPRVQAVGAQQVSEFAAAHWPVSAARAVVAGPPGAAWPDAADALRVPLARLDLGQRALRSR
jgi:zinc protease